MVQAFISVNMSSQGSSVVPQDILDQLEDENDQDYPFP